MLPISDVSIASRSTISTIALVAALIATPAFAQDAAAPAAPAAPTAPAAAETEAPAAADEIVVTGFRASLNSALSIKRTETAAVDSIVAEDIGKFPDSNLAESMQRIPGVVLSRGDGGEGRNIAVRGLGAQFTRVRINGMEGSSQTGSSDIYGAGNSGRSFDFNVFPTEIFSSLAVRKTTSADVEEGSLGATVDLKAPHPLDYKTDFVISGTVRGVYNEVSEKLDPRASMLVSKQFADGTFGVLGSLAYSKRNIREVGYSAVDILSANTNGLSQTVAGTATVFPFCTPVGYTLNGVAVNSPAASTANGGVNIGANAANCSTGNPRTSTLAAFNTVFNARRADAATTPGSGAFLPRIPRYVNSTQDAERIGGTLTLQWKPTDDTDISVDGLYSRFDVTRRDNYIAGISFGRSITNIGQPATSVRDIQLDANGSLVYGLFDGVDVRSEGLEDHFVSTFKQVNLNFQHRFSDAFEIQGTLGRSHSFWDGKERLQTFIDAIDVDGFAIDFRDGGRTPNISFGNIDVSNPAAFNYAPNGADGTFLGGFSTQGKPSENKTKNTLAEIQGNYTLNDVITFKAGGQFRESDYTARGATQYFGQNVVTALPAGVTLASITKQITGADEHFSGAPASWAAIDPDAWRRTFNFPGNYQFCTTADCGVGTSQIRERIKSAFVMANFNAEDLPIPIRGDIGVRYVHTDQRAVGFLTSALLTSPTRVTATANVVERKYDDWLPSGNLVLEFTPTLLGRLSAAKVLSRPEFGPLIPSSASITATTRTGSANNPFLNPIRANTFDAALEWYFKPGSLLSVAYFYKDIKTFIQTSTSMVPFNTLGLPDTLLNGTNTAPTEIFTIRQPLNTPGGPLKGFELNGQTTFDFLPGFLSHFGVLGNYTRVKSKIDYILASGATYTADLVGLSKNSASGTIFWEDDRFSIRATASYRDKYIRSIIGSGGNDYQGNLANTFVDASASYNVTENIKLILEAQNLTNERNTLFIGSVRQDTLFETKIGRTINVGANVKF